MKAPGALACLLAAALAGCATRSDQVLPQPAPDASFAGWSCERLDDELDRVQQRAADVAYAVDERAGNNIVALGVGVTIFWPAILAMRPDGPEAAELARLKGRDEALRSAARGQDCPPPSPLLPPGRAAALPVAAGERLVYEERPGARRRAREWSIDVAALRRDGIEYRRDGAPWQHDPAGNLVLAPPGALVWPRLLPRELALGQVLGGEIAVNGDPLQRARVRGQVMALGAQTLAGRRFDVAVIDLFGDAVQGDASTRVDGALVVDRASGVLLRLDLRSAVPAFDLQRRLARVEAPAP